MEEEMNVKDVLKDSYDLLIEGIINDAKWKKGKYEIESRTKLKSLMEALRQHDTPEDNILHFIKYSEYFLPRSGFNKTLNLLLNKISNIEKRNKDKKNALNEIKHTVGYTLWTADGLCNIFTETSKEGDGKVKEHVKKMIDTEFEIAELKDDNKKSKIVDAIIKWYDEANKFYESKRGDKNV